MLRPEPCPVRRALTGRPVSIEMTVMEGRPWERGMEAMGGTVLTSQECHGGVEWGAG